MRGLLFMIILFALAAPANADPKEAKRLAEVLREYQKMKSREGFLQMMIRRTTPGQREKYSREYEALKPKLYDTAQQMELGVQSYERKYGKKALCKSLASDVKTLVPSCSAK